MITLRRCASVLRTAFFVGAWSVAALVPMFFAVVKANAGYMAISVAVLILGGLTTRAPDESRIEGLTDPFGRFMFLVAVCLSTVGAVLVWPR